MAKDDGDFIDFLLSTVFKFFGWIFMGIFKLLFFLVSALFTGIVSLFKNKNKETASTEEKQ